MLAWYLPGGNEERNKNLRTAKLSRNSNINVLYLPECKISIIFVTHHHKNGRLLCNHTQSCRCSVQAFPCKFKKLEGVNLYAALSGYVAGMVFLKKIGSFMLEKKVHCLLKLVYILDNFVIT